MILVSFRCFLNLLLFWNCKFDVVFEQIPQIDKTSINFLGVNFNAVDLICLLLFIGAMGKSAQIFLHTWLLDAWKGRHPYLHLYMQPQW